MANLIVRSFRFTFLSAYFVLGFSLIPSTQADFVWNACSQTGISIGGPEEVKVGTSQEYRAVQDVGEFRPGDRFVYELWKDGKLVESIQKEKYLRFFSEAGMVDVHAIVTHSDGCISEAKKSVRIYEKTLAYIGENDFIDTNVRSRLKERSILLREIRTAVSSSIPGSKDFSSLIEKNHRDIEEADYVILRTKRPAEFFEAATRDQKESPNSEKKPMFSEKEVYVVDEGGGYLLSLMVAGYAEQLGMDRIWAIGQKNVFNLLLLIGTSSYVGSGLASEIDFGKTSGGTEFRKAFNRMAYSGFPISFIGFVLSLVAAALVLAIFRQIVGFHTFGTFWPLFFIVSISASNIQNVGVLLLSALISTWITDKSFAKFRISYGARKTFALWVYSIIAIIILSALKWLEIFDGLEIYANQVAILPFIFILLVADKLYADGLSGRIKETASAIAQFSAVCLATYFIMESQWVRNALLSYPESIFAILTAIVATGRYSGLQITEYYRFLPLIQEKLSESKKEE